MYYPFFTKEYAEHLKSHKRLELFNILILKLEKKNRIHCERLKGINPADVSLWSENMARI